MLGSRLYGCGREKRRVAICGDVAGAVGADGQGSGVESSGTDGQIAVAAGEVKQRRYMRLTQQ